jgi:hypothetical protein
MVPWHKSIQPSAFLNKGFPSSSQIALPTPISRDQTRYALFRHNGLRLNLLSAGPITVRTAYQLEREIEESSVVTRCFGRNKRTIEEPEEWQWKRHTHSRVATE